ncbi:hypothetical protein QP185_20095 [Sphingomonas aerolata]|uniref:hypothetical protein n=1 Tax=Sphingomonas aerolata TaxID=185951 RepID=UPI002FE27E35
MVVLDLPPSSPKLYGIYSKSTYCDRWGEQCQRTRIRSSRYVRTDIGGWGMAEFNFADRGPPIRGDVGVRYASTDQRSTGYAGCRASRPTSSSRTGAIIAGCRQENLVMDVTDTLLVRLRQQATRRARWNLGDRTGGNLGVSGGNQYVQQRQPRFDADGIGQSRRFGQNGIRRAARSDAVSAFQKDIGTFVQSLGTTVPFSSLLPAGLAPWPVRAITATDLFIVSQPVNSSSGRLKSSRSTCNSPSASCRDSCPTSACWRTTRT